MFIKSLAYSHVLLFERELLYLFSNIVSSTKAVWGFFVLNDLRSLLALLKRGLYKCVYHIKITIVRPINIHVIRFSSSVAAIVIVPFYYL
jgi:hypothetical protein